MIKKNGKWIEQTGMQSQFHLKHKGNYVNGKKNGIWMVYRTFSSGVWEFFEKREYIKSGDKLKIKLWNESGQQTAEKNYEGKKKDGLWMTWYKTGVKETEEYYAAGILKKRLWWYINGQLWEEKIYDIDSIVMMVLKSWYKSGKIKEQQKFLRTKDGEGFVENYRWYENGQKEYENKYINGQKGSISTGWYENGQKIFENKYPDEEEAILTRWYKNGQKNSEKYYKQGVLIKAFYWKENGEIL